MNEKIYEHLQSVREKSRKVSVNDDGLKNIAELCELSVLDDIMNISHENNTCGCIVLRHSLQWVKLRYGWDLRLAYYECGVNVILKPINWEAYDLRMAKKLFLVACNNKFHK